MLTKFITFTVAAFAKKKLQSNIGKSSPSINVIVGHIWTVLAEDRVTSEQIPGGN